MKTVRLDKFLSDNTSMTRSQIRIAAKRGEIAVNGVTQRKFDVKINADCDTILLNNEVVKYQKFIYLMMNKPAGILTASRDASRQTVIDLVPEKFRHYNLFAVGRLDKDTTGLLLLTNDGDYAHRVISPKNSVEKSYIAKVDGVGQNGAADIFAKGMILSDGTVCRPATLEFLDNDTVRVIITEGKYHQVKRMLGHIGLGVIKLHRERIGLLSLPSKLKEGEIVELTPEQSRLCLAAFNAKFVDYKQKNN